MNINSKKGFTLVEVIVVVSIMAILVAISVPSLTGIYDNIQVSICDSNKNILENAYKTYVSFEETDAILDNDDISEFLIQHGIMDEYISCPSDGVYLLENGEIKCSVHDVSSSNESSGDSTGDTSDNNSGDSSGDTPILYDGIDYVFTTKNYDSSSFNYKLKITNNGTEKITGWVVEFNYPGTILSSWSGDFEDLGNHKYSITSYDYNYSISPGSSITLQGSGSSFAGNTISDFLIKKTYDRIDASVSFAITNSWSNGFNYSVSITNNTSQMITGWTLEFTYDGTIKKAWDAKFEKISSTRFGFSNPESYNITIPANGTISFTGQGNNESSNPPSDAVLNGVSIPIS